MLLKAIGDNTDNDKRPVNPKEQGRLKRQIDEIEKKRQRNLRKSKVGL